MKNHDRAFIALYVDDLLIFVKDMLVINKVKHALSHEFKMKYLYEAEYCIGIQIIRNKVRRTISLMQLKYVGDILSCVGMETYKFVKAFLMSM
jgi:hypothetical protein